MCIGRCIDTLVAFVWFFSTVRFQMCPQIAYLRVALVALVWLFSAVRFKMILQSACIRRCKVTLAAFVWLFSTVYFQMPSQISCFRGGIFALVALVWPLFRATVFCFSHQSLNISIAITHITTFKIFIHHYPVEKDVVSTQAVANWRKIIFGIQKKNVKVKRMYETETAYLALLKDSKSKWFFMLELCATHACFFGLSFLYISSNKISTSQSYIFLWGYFEWEWGYKLKSGGSNLWENPSAVIFNLPSVKIKVTVVAFISNCDIQCAKQISPFDTFEFHNFSISSTFDSFIDKHDINTTFNFF